MSEFLINIIVLLYQNETPSRMFSKIYFYSSSGQLFHKKAEWLHARNLHLISKLTRRNIVTFRTLVNLKKP